jgi:hypothetical protein
VAKICIKKIKKKKKARFRERHMQRRNGVCTYHIAWSSILTPEFLLLVQRVGKSHEELPSAFKACHFVARPRLQASSECLERQGVEPDLVGLIFVAGIPREQPLSLESA